MPLPLCTCQLSCSVGQMLLSLHGCFHTLNGGLNAFIGGGHGDTHIAFTCIAKVCTWCNEDASFVKEPVRVCVRSKPLGDSGPDIQTGLRCLRAHAEGIAAFH